MTKHPIVVLLSGYGSNLQAIIKKSKHSNIVAVISDDVNAFGLERASRADIFNCSVRQHRDDTREQYCLRLSRIVSNLHPKLVVLAGFMKVLTPNFFEPFHEKQIVNIHPSLLPKHKGGGPSHNTHQIVLDEKDEEHGITIHYVVPEVDSGPILWQSQFFIQPEDTAETLETKVHKLEHQWYPWVIDQILKENM